LCDDVMVQTYVDIAPYMRDAPMIFETQDVRVVWYHGPTTYLGKVGKPDVRAYAPPSKWSKKATKSKNSSKFLVIRDCWGGGF
jgi:hypothetical protein